MGFFWGALLLVLILVHVRTLLRAFSEADVRLSGGSGGGSSRHVKPRRHRHENQCDEDCGDARKAPQQHEGEHVGGVKQTREHNHIYGQVPQYDTHWDRFFLDGKINRSIRPTVDKA